MHGLVFEIGIAFLAATTLGFIFQLFRQPVILGYLVAGALIGPQVGLKFVADPANIAVISEIGLILLLFIIGLELNPTKLLSAGRQLSYAGIGQFILCVLTGLGFFIWIGYNLSGSNLDALYLALVCALNSTAIVVKLLYDKFELDSVEQIHKLKRLGANEVLLPYSFIGNYLGVFVKEMVEQFGPAKKNAKS